MNTWKPRATQLPDAETQAAIHQHYLRIHADTVLERHTRRAMLEAMLTRQPWSWQVVGITEQALAILRGNKYRYVSRALQRGHIVSRDETTATMLDGDPLDLQEFWRLFWTNNVAVIMTSGQNNSDSWRDDTTHQIDPDHGLFPSQKLVGWKHAVPHEVAYLKALDAAQANAETTSSK